MGGSVVNVIVRMKGATNAGTKSVISPHSAPRLSGKVLEDTPVFKHETNFIDTQVCRKVGYYWKIKESEE